MQTLCPVQWMRCIIRIKKFVNELVSWLLVRSGNWFSALWETGLGFFASSCGKVLTDPLSPNFNIAAMPSISVGTLAMELIAPSRLTALLSVLTIACIFSVARTWSKCPGIFISPSLGDGFDVFANLVASGGWLVLAAHRIVANHDASTQDTDSWIITQLVVELCLVNVNTSRAVFHLQIISFLDLEGIEKTSRALDCWCNFWRHWSLCQKLKWACPSLGNNFGVQRSFNFFCGLITRFVPDIESSRTSGSGA